MLFVVLLFGISHAGRAQPTMLLDNGLDANWSEPVPVIKHSSTRLALFNVTFAETNRGIFTFGNTLPDPADYNTAEGQKIYAGNERLIAVNLNGKRMPVPDGDFTFAYPKALADSAGAVHLLWAKPDSTDQQMSQYQSVWYARYTNGKWSNPTIIYQPETLQWEVGSKSDFIVDSRGILHLLFVANEKHSGSATTGFTHLYKNKTGWHSNFYPNKRAISCGYIDLLATDSGTLHMTCIGTDFDTNGDINSVFFSSSTDNGQSWSTPELVSRSGKKQAHDTQLLTTSDGSLHLLWSKSRDANFMPETIWHVRSQDGGKSWSKPVDLDPRQPAFSFEITADTNDHFHLVYTSHGQNNFSTYYKMWDGNRWGPDTGPILPGNKTQYVSPILITRNNRLRFAIITIKSIRPPLPGNTLYLEKKLNK